MNYTVYKVKVFENGDKIWRNERGELHNEHGPAIEYYDGRKYYYFNGLPYIYEDWKEQVEKLNKPEVKELTVSQVNQLLGFDVKIVK